jgi:kumamolisin
VSLADGPFGRRSPLAGSERKALAGARFVRACPDDTALEAAIVLRPRDGAAAALAAATHATFAARAYLTRDELGALRSADPAALELARAFAAAQGLDVRSSDAARRTLVVAGSYAQMRAAFGVTLQFVECDGQTIRMRTGAIVLPAALHASVLGVFGLDDRVQARSHIRRRSVRPALAGAVAFEVPQLGAIYNFPTGDGAGQTIGLIELGGGYDPSDAGEFFAGLGLPAPALVDVAIDGAANAPDGDPQGADGEVQFDIDVAGALAPAAKLAVYFAPNSDRGFLDAVSSAIHDSANGTSIVSISWGAAESAWTAAALQALDDAFADAALLGVTVCCASGDDGSSDRVSDGAAHVDFPASSPHVLACGGTRLVAQGTTVVDERAWNTGPGAGATGGGVSDTFPLPAWQAAANVPPSVNPGGRIGRGVPDVAALADPATGYQVRVDGTPTVLGGTSGAAPLWAALVARLNERLGQPVGFLNSALYAHARDGVTRDITLGTNGAYAAGPGWDACTGLGSPNGEGLLQALLPAGGGAPPAS